MLTVPDKFEMIPGHIWPSADLVIGSSLLSAKGDNLHVNTQAELRHLQDVGHSVQCPAAVTFHIRLILEFINFLVLYS